MPDTMKCSDAACGATIDTSGKEIGDVVTCPKCGKENKVLADFGDAFDISGIMPADDEQAHPARIKCTACGQLLGVRDAVCKNCGADVRSGVSQIRITREDKAKRGLFSRKPKSKPVAAPPARPTPGGRAPARGGAAPAPRAAAVPKRPPVRVVKRQKNPLAIALIAVVALALVAGAVVAVLVLAK
jgi:hypothetical protein